MLNAEVEQRIIAKGRPEDLARYRAVHTEDANNGDGEPMPAYDRLLERYKNQLIFGLKVPEESAEMICSQLNEQIKAAEADPKKDPNKLVKHMLDITRNVSLAIKGSRKLQPEHVSVAKETVVYPKR